MVPDDAPAELDVLDVADDTQADELAALEEQTPIDPAHEPPLRAALLRLPGHSEILLAVHHVVCDGPALDVLLADLAAGYSGPLGAPPADFRGYAAAATDPPASRAVQAARALDGWPARSRHRDAIPRLQPATTLRDLDPQLVAHLIRSARLRHTTLYAVLLTGFGNALGAITGLRRLVVGTVTSARPHPDLERSVGQYANLIPVALDLAGDDPVAATTTALLTALRFTDVPFPHLVAADGGPRNDHYSPIVQVIFEHLAQEPATLDFAGTPGILDLRSAGQGAVCDLYLRVLPYRGGLRCMSVRDASVVSQAVVDEVLDRAEANWRVCGQIA